MKSGKITVSFFTLMSLLSSCGSKNNPIRNEDARRLFEETVELLNGFSNHISIAGDSLEIDSIYDILGKELTDLNFKYPPNTDLHLTEQENDSVSTLMTKLIKLRNHRLEELNQKYEEAKDSIEQ